MGARPQGPVNAPLISNMLNSDNKQQLRMHTRSTLAGQCSSSPVVNCVQQRYTYDNKQQLRMHTRSTLAGKCSSSPVVNCLFIGIIQEIVDDVVSDELVTVLSQYYVETKLGLQVGLRWWPHPPPHWKGETGMFGMANSKKIMPVKLASLRNGGQDLRSGGPSEWRTVTTCLRYADTLADFTMHWSILHVNVFELLGPSWYKNKWSIMNFTVQKCCVQPITGQT